MLNIISLRCDLGGEGDRAAVAGGAARTLALLSLLCARASEDAQGKGGRGFRVIHRV